ncbi:putative transposase [Spraguea lophii 42_110]|uniref:Putative transposase n=1 Tax=Spraguea lophii (strain 42_110) TaxID=1358809 RepID=S7W4Y9_SPRLO|nr:putative transposase [Spraguea lophii 42_110]
MCYFFTRWYIHHKILDGAYNVERFKIFIKEVHDKGIFHENTMLILDNVRFHKTNEILYYLTEKNIRYLFLPTYSPEFNPIENTFSCLKSYISNKRSRTTRRIF